jgi:hypothetical protein
MTTHDDIIRAIGRLEGRLIAFENLPQRICNLERNQFWMKSGWTALVCMYGWLLRLVYVR